jgi:hypothetical protein
MGMEYLLGLMVNSTVGGGSMANKKVMAKLTLEGHLQRLRLVIIRMGRSRTGWMKTRL